MKSAAFLRFLLQRLTTTVQPTPAKGLGREALLPSSCPSVQGALSLEASYSAGAPGWRPVPQPLGAVPPAAGVMSRSPATGGALGAASALAAAAAAEAEGPLARGSRLFSSPSAQSASTASASPDGLAAAQAEVGASGGEKPRHVRGMTAAWLQQTATWLLNQQQPQQPAPLPLPPQQPQPEPPSAPLPPPQQQQEAPLVHQYRQWRWGGGVALPGGVGVNVYAERSSSQTQPSAAAPSSPPPHV